MSPDPEFLAEMEALGREKHRLAGLGLPDVLICGPPHEWDTEYLPAGAATWRHLLAARAEAERKGRDGQEVTEALRKAADRLRPHMESDPACTIEEALLREAATEKSSG
ncbi:MAG: hypothetical protein ABR564_06430 [Candidatus Dormibacteria bacterium]